MNISLEVFLAAMIHEAGGNIVINMETLSNGFDGKIIAIDTDPRKDILVLSLVEADDVGFEDESADA